MIETVDKFGLKMKDTIRIVFKIDRKVKGLLWDNYTDDYLYDLEVAKQPRRI